MTRRKWTTPEQEAWFRNLVNEFRAAEASNTRKAFYQKTLSMWLEKWPNPAPTQEQIAAAKSVELATANIYNFQKKVSLRNIESAEWYSLYPSATKLGFGTTSARP